MAILLNISINFFYKVEENYLHYNLNKYVSRHFFCAPLFKKKIFKVPRNIHLLQLSIFKIQE